MSETTSAEAMAAILDGLKLAMDAENVEPATRQRVLNRLIWGHPHGDPSATMPAGKLSDGV